MICELLVRQNISTKATVVSILHIPHIHIVQKFSTQEEIVEIRQDT